MVEDQEGFSYPRINSNLCVDCGLCEKVCPKLNIRQRLNTLGYFAVKNNNESERLASSSGGVFILLAKEIISSGGVVLVRYMMKIGKFIMFRQLTWLRFSL